jgi:copper chaperone CopZ
MYRHILIVLFLAALGGCQASGTANSSQQTASTSPTSDGMSGASATLVVHGMGCPMCANNVDRQLLRIPGVQKAKINLGTGEVAVQFAPEAHPSRQKIVDAVEQSGFTLHDIRQP